MLLSHLLGPSALGVRARERIAHTLTHTHVFSTMFLKLFYKKSNENFCIGNQKFHGYTRACTCTRACGYQHTYINIFIYTYVYVRIRLYAHARTNTRTMFYNI